jgi:hypothetical protein
MFWPIQSFGVTAPATIGALPMAVVAAVVLMVIAVDAGLLSTCAHVEKRPVRSLHERRHQLNRFRATTGAVSTVSTVSELRLGVRVRIRATMSHAIRA